MISRDALLTVEWFVGFLSLAFGCLGQAAFAGPVLKLYLPAWIGGVIVALPVLIVFIFGSRFFPPRAFRLCLLFAMCWFAVLTISAEILCHRGYMPPDSPAYARTSSRVLMHVGWLSFIPLIRLYIFNRRNESKRDTYPILR